MAIKRNVSVARKMECEPRGGAWLRVSLGALMAFFSAASWAVTNDALHAFFADVRSFRAEFEQTVFDENLRPLQSTAGMMALERPGRFRWDYAKPYEQHIVGDGEKVWIYDVDLEQVTVRSQQEALGDTPAQLLSTTEPLESNFEITPLGEQKGVMWFQLVPKLAESQFQRVRLGFNQQMLVRMELEDGLGSTTLLEFHDPKRNIILDKTLFRFEPPPGVDVVGP